MTFWQSNLVKIIPIINKAMAEHQVIEPLLIDLFKIIREAALEK